MFEDIREVKLFGLGLAIAVLVDATLVRMAVVPATMEPLGDKNWWIPRWLDRILPHLALEGSDLPREVHTGPADVTGLEGSRVGPNTRTPWLPRSRGAGRGVLAGGVEDAAD